MCIHAIHFLPRMRKNSIPLNIQVHLCVEYRTDSLNKTEFLTQKLRGLRANNVSCAPVENTDPYFFLVHQVDTSQLISHIFHQQRDIHSIGQTTYLILYN